MVMHARSGGNLEVMGLLLGKVDANVMVVMDSFALPVEGTETRVNAQAQGYEYMTAYIEAAKQVTIILCQTFGIIWILIKLIGCLDSEQYFQFINIRLGGLKML